MRTDVPPVWQAIPALLGPGLASHTAGCGRARGSQGVTRGSLSEWAQRGGSSKITARRERRVSTWTTQPSRTPMPVKPQATASATVAKPAGMSAARPTRCWLRGAPPTLLLVAADLYPDTIGRGRPIRLRRRSNPARRRASGPTRAPVRRSRNSAREKWGDRSPIRTRAAATARGRDGVGCRTRHRPIRPSPRAHCRSSGTRRPNRCRAPRGPRRSSARRHDPAPSA